VDPFGGRRDIAARRLRLVREENFADDPLRTLRAARFFATHGLEPDARTKRACRRFAPMLSGVALERIGAELSKLLGADRAGPAFDWARSAGLLPAALGLEIGRRRLAVAARHLHRLDARLGRLVPRERRVIRLTAIADAAGLGRPRPPPGFGAAGSAGPRQPPRAGSWNSFETRRRNPMRRPRIGRGSTTRIGSRRPP
jgi:hypothetical protein